MLVAPEISLAVSGHLVNEPLDKKGSPELNQAYEAFKRSNELGRLVGTRITPTRLVCIL